MKKIFLIICLLIGTMAAQAQAADNAYWRGYFYYNNAGVASIVTEYVVVDSASGDGMIMEATAIVDPALPGTWRAAIAAAIAADATSKGYTTSTANVKLPVFEAGDFKEIKLWASWPKDITKTNLPTTLTNVYLGLGGEQQLVDFGGYTQYRWVVYWNKIGTGTQVVQLVDAGNTANYLTWSDTAAAGEHSYDTGWANLAAWMAGEKLLKAMASSTVATDDPICRGVYLYLR